MRVFWEGRDLPFLLLVEDPGWAVLHLLASKSVRKDPHPLPHESCPSLMESELLKWGPGVSFLKAPW